MVISNNSSICDSNPPLKDKPIIHMMGEPDNISNEKGSSSKGKAPSRPTGASIGPIDNSEESRARIRAAIVSMDNSEDNSQDHKARNRAIEDMVDFVVDPDDPAHYPEDPKAPNRALVSSIDSTGEDFMRRSTVIEKHLKEETEKHYLAQIEATRKHDETLEYLRSRLIRPKDVQKAPEGAHALKLWETISDEIDKNEDKRCEIEGEHEEFKALYNPSKDGKDDSREDAQEYDSSLDGEHDSE